METKVITQGELTWETTYDEHGNIVHHKGPSTEWTKEYDDQHREVKYICGDRIVNTWYDADGTAHNDDSQN